MKVLLCWSGERSRLIASHLRDWLPRVLPALEPWMSEEDISKGADWSNELHKTLDHANAALVCLTPENMRSPWIYYECGRVSAKAKSNRIHPFLLGTDARILKDGPLQRFQCTIFSKEDVFRLAASLNKDLDQASVSESVLAGAFEREWSGFEGTVLRIQQIDSQEMNEGTRVRSAVEQLAGCELSEEMRKLIIQMGKDQHGYLLVSVTSGGHCFQASGQNLNANETPRSTAKWYAAIKQMLRNQLIEAKGGKGEVFALTSKGYDVYDSFEATQS